MRIPEKFLSSSKIFNYMILIFVLGCILRFWGLLNAYPHSFYGDEIHFVNRALSFGSGDLNPHWFHKPAFLMYLLFFEYGIFFVVGKLLSFWQNVTDFAVFYISNPGPFYIIGRFTVVLFSISSLLLTWKLARRYFGKITAFTSLLAMSLSYGAIVTQKNVKADGPCAFFTLLSAYFLLKYFDNSSSSRKLKFLFFSSIAAGIGTATKYYSVLMLFTIVFSIIFFDNTNLKLKIRNSFLQLLSFFISFFFFSPFNFLDKNGFSYTFSPFFSLINKLKILFSLAPMPNVSAVSNSTEQAISPLSILFSTATKYISEMAVGLNPVVLIFCLLGIIIIIKNKKLLGVVFLIYPLIFLSLSILLKPSDIHLRYQLTIYPFIAVFAGFFLQLTYKHKKIFTICAILIAVFFLNDVVRIIRYNALLSKPDIRNIAQEWIENNLEQDSRIILDEDGPYLVQCKEQISEQIDLAKTFSSGTFTTHYSQYLDYQLHADLPNTSFYIFQIRIPWWRGQFLEEGVHYLDSDFDSDMGNPTKPVGVYKYEEFVERGYKYAVIHSCNYDPFIKTHKKSEFFPTYDLLYRDIFSKGTKVKSFSGMVLDSHPGSFKPMTIDIFRLE